MKLLNHNNGKLFTKTMHNNNEEIMVDGEKHQRNTDKNACKTQDTLNKTPEKNQPDSGMRASTQPDQTWPRPAGLTLYTAKRNLFFSLLFLLLLRSRQCKIFSPMSKAKSVVCRSVSTGPQSFLWASTGLGHVWRLKASKVGQDCRMWLGVWGPVPLNGKFQRETKTGCRGLNGEER